MTIPFRKPIPVRPFEEKPYFLEGKNAELLALLKSRGITSVAKFEEQWYRWLSNKGRTAYGVSPLAFNRVTVLIRCFLAERPLSPRDQASFARYFDDLRAEARLENLATATPQEAEKGEAHRPADRPDAPKPVAPVRNP